MAVSSFSGRSGASGASGSNDFSLSVGAASDTNYTLESAKPAGVYSISYLNADATYDVYFSSSGTNVGYSNTTIITATAEFDKVTVLGVDENNIAFFTYEGQSSSANADSVEGGSVAIPLSLSPSSLPDIDDTTTITGINFSNNITVTFTGTDAVERSAKTVSRSSSTQLIVTRPDDLPVDYSPYTVTVLNVGISQPSSVSVSSLSNSVTAGTTPSWNTARELTAYTIDAAYSEQLDATDVEGSAITYSLVSGSLQSGFTLSSSGLISGTTSSTTPATFTVRATDAGGNFLDKELYLAPPAPTFNFDESTIPDSLSGIAYSFDFSATPVAPQTISSYSLQSGSLPGGLSLNTSTGFVTGTSSGTGTGTAVIRATDSLGLYVDYTWNWTAKNPTRVNITSSQSYTTPAGTKKVFVAAMGGGGRGGDTATLSSASGGGGSGRIASGWVDAGTYSVAVGGQGGTSTFGNVSASGGGGGGSAGNNASGGGGSGGSGGASGNGGTGGSDGGSSTNSPNAGSGVTIASITAPGWSPGAGGNSNNGGAFYGGGGGGGGQFSGGPVNGKSANGQGGGGGGARSANSGVPYGGNGGSGGTGYISVYY